MRVLIALFVFFVAAAAAPPQTQPEMVDNPTYLSWMQYKPGTTVTVKILSVTKTTTLTDDPKLQRKPTTTESVMVQKLMEASPDGVILEATVTAQVNGKPEVHTEKWIFPSKMEKDQPYVAGYFPAIGDYRVKELTTGTDTIDFKDEKMAAVTQERTVDSPTSPESAISSKLWYVRKIPGGVARLEHHRVEKIGQIGDAPTMMDITSTVTLVDYALVTK